MSTLTIRDLVVLRGNKPVVDGISLSIPSGSITSLIGPNGAGKSSLVLALCGVLPVQSGSVEVDGISLVGKPPEFVRQNGVAAVPEGHRVLSMLSVEDNLRAAGFHLPSSDVPGAVAKVYEIFPELAERKEQKAGSMSGGQQQMLALGQALVVRPKFILADEMSLGLAPLIVKRLMGVIEDLAESGTGVLLIEQFTNVALKLGNEAYVMTRGKFSYSGSPAPLINDPRLLHKAYLA